MTKKGSSFDNSHKEAIEREVDKLLAEKPKNCMKQVTLREVQGALKGLNSYSAPGQDRIGTLLIKNGGDYLHKTITDILNQAHSQGDGGGEDSHSARLKKVKFALNIKHALFYATL